MIKTSLKEICVWILTTIVMMFVLHVCDIILVYFIIPLHLADSLQWPTNVRGRIRGIYENTLGTELDSSNQNEMGKGLKIFEFGLSDDLCLVFLMI